MLIVSEAWQPMALVVVMEYAPLSEIAISCEEAPLLHWYSIVLSVLVTRPIVLPTQREVSFGRTVVNG